MTSFFRRRLSVLFPVVLGLFQWACGAPAASAAIQYTISLDHPERHLFSVEMQIPDVTGSVTVQMPAWNALYQVRDFSSHVRQVTALADGKPAPVDKLDKQSWHITGSGTIAVSYTIYWDEPGPFATQLNSEHAFISPAMVLVYVPERRAEEISLTLRDIPEGWQIAASLAGLDAEFSRTRLVVFQAKSYDSLVDAPLEVGRFEAFDLPDFSPRIHVVVHGDNWKRDRVIETLRRICRYELDLMQDQPFETYTFIFHIGKAAAGAGGGMEHANSTAINVPSDELLAGVSAHEFFHLWNVKRIRPSSLEPVDYTKEQWTRALWFAEGVTSTYGSYTMLRSGLWTKDQFYADLGNQITELQSRPANRWKSAEESSLDAWLEKYLLYNSPDESVSYYTKGQMLGMLLDILIRDRTGNTASLDDVMRTLNTEFAKRGKTYRDTLDVRLTAEKVAGGSFEEFFRRYVSGTNAFPYVEVLALAGLELRERKGNRAALGFTINRDPSGEARVAGLLPDGAASAAGLHDGDKILRWNDVEIPRRIERWLAERAPGGMLRLRLQREAKELAVEFPLDGRAVTEWQATESHTADEKAKRIREGLLRGVTQRRAGAAAP